MLDRIDLVTLLSKRKSLLEITGLVQHGLGCHLDERNVENLGDERYRSRGTKIGLDNTNPVILDKELRVERSGNLECLGNLGRVVLDVRHDVIADAMCGEYLYFFIV